MKENDEFLTAYQLSCAQWKKIGLIYVKSRFDAVNVIFGQKFITTHPGNTKSHKYVL